LVEDYIVVSATTQDGSPIAETGEVNISWETARSSIRQSYIHLHSRPESNDFGASLNFILRFSPAAPFTSPIFLESIVAPQQFATHGIISDLLWRIDMFRNQLIQKIRRSWVVAILAASMAFAQYTQPIGDNGSVDWSQQKIKATGIGAPNPNSPPGAQRAGAITAAKSDALRNLLATVRGMFLTSETTVNNAIVENDVIKTRVEGYLRGFTVVDLPRYMSDQSVEVDVEIPLSGIADAVLPQSFGGGRYASGQPVCPMCGQPWPQGKAVPPGVQLTVPSAGGQTPTGSTGGAFTGLIIDAKGLGVMPAMAPKVVNESGEEVYGSKYVSREFAVKQGMVGYDKDLNAARNNPRVTNNPLIVKGMKASGANSTDIVVSNADAQRIHAAAQSQNFLDKTRVMVILE
jgi:hypothetical protein